MARDADYDVDLFAELVRSGKITEGHTPHALNGNSDSRSNGNSGDIPSNGSA